jgi:hypothetical protein
MTGDLLRQLFNRNFSQDRYDRFQSLVAERAGCPVPFRLAETPCFFDFDFMRRCSRDGETLIHQLTDNEDYWAASADAVPAPYRVPNEPRLPLFVQVDFGVVRNDDGLLEPRLVEIQAFPSLYAFQPVLGQAYIDAYELPSDLEYLLDGLDMPSYAKILKEAIVGDHDPAEVVLLEIDPDHQKTRPDFLLTEKLLGVRTVCISRVTARGASLFYSDNGRETPIRRIYNRAIFDELERRNVAVPFDWRESLSVEWAGHPNHYFRISKFSLPWLNHHTVPESRYLHQCDPLPDDLDRWVLKPLYSFAGLGVAVGPSKADIERIPPDDRPNWILQRRVDFTPVIETPHGFTKAEIRVMYVGLRPVTHIIRLGRGQQMGVDFNKNLDWVGASAALYHRES